MLNGLNHLTLAVSDLARGVHFYQSTLGMRLHAHWDHGAYLSAGELWLCLSFDPNRASISGADYTHYAFTVEQGAFADFVTAMRAAGVVEWKDNRSEGASFYFLDPDGHQLEAHVGDLASRLRACRDRPYAGMQFFD
ncbi:catechol 2,3-dioxygenase-like lactoylglutathione lyase family enzyme [Collimonas sp. PA-H2]|uniref:fosfomycin resistance glutathione transferase n=1 Tax=Collimonas sp. PA-H2 TaxID=1881062 RepID=UPI000BF24CEA|nr:fosfomycin resistance glutathione transferase [Collimonas sp. PA-H2]PFH11428.1 catechol 2,3-dioxygenase-like lactoylglutathione lyase family enzyme [Collimonas sp. PA-H2]